MSNYQIPFTGQELEERLNWLDTLYKQTINHSQYFEIDNTGLISLKPEYRGPGGKSYPYSVSNNGPGFKGSLNSILPEHLYVPLQVNGINVTGFQIGAFVKHNRLKELTLHDNIISLPDRLFSHALQFEKLNHTEQIITIGTGCFTYTSIKEINLPNLQTSKMGAFANASYLSKINIGNYITTLPEQMFVTCIALASVEGGAAVTSVGKKCFSQTRNLKTLPLLSNTNLTLGDQAFYGSRIQFDWSSRNSANDGKYATPVVDNTTDYWTGTSYTACANSISTKLSQGNAAYKTKPIGTTGLTYDAGCAYFAAMHIHSAFQKKQYTHPQEFIDELAQNENTKKYLENQYQLSVFANDYPFFVDLGYSAKQYDVLNAANYQEMCSAIAAGALVFTQCTYASNQLNGNDSNLGHVVVLYGMNAEGEMHVLDSAIPAESYRVDGYLDPDFYTYTIAHPNLVGPNSKFIVVYPPN